MTDACVIRKPATGSVFDTVTGEYADTLGALVYEGPCRVQVPEVGEREPVAGEQVFSLRVAIVSVPIDVTAAVPGDVVTITSSAMDPALPGVTYRVLVSDHKTSMTARRLRCEEKTSG